MVTAFKCSYCNLVFEGLLGSDLCPKCDSFEFVKRAATYPIIPDYTRYIENEADKDLDRIIGGEIDSLPDYRLGVR